MMMNSIDHISEARLLFEYKVLSELDHVVDEQITLRILCLVRY